MTHKQAVDKLDKVFSEYIRRRKADYLGNAICVTCGTTKHWKQQQAGHYFSRGHYGTRWDYDNVHTQCVGCNVFKKGNYPKYAQYMYRLYGQQFMNDMEARADGGRKWSVPELEDMITEVKSRLESLTN